MSLVKKQQEMVQRYRMIEDPQERLTAIISRGGKKSVLSDAERSEANRVLGCQSAVWVVATREGEQVRYRSEADSPLVKGLVALLCELYDGALATEIISVEPALWDELGLSRQLSPTRLNGLASVRARIRELAL
jgi:cysteine desulfuration protein SufE